MLVKYLVFFISKNISGNLVALFIRVQNILIQKFISTVSVHVCFFFQSIRIIRWSESFKILDKTLLRITHFFVISNEKVYQKLWMFGHFNLKDGSSLSRTFTMGINTTEGLANVEQLVLSQKFWLYSINETFWDIFWPNVKA